MLKNETGNDDENTKILIMSSSSNDMNNNGLRRRASSEIILDYASSDGTEKKIRESDIGICWLYPPPTPLSVEWLFSIRGFENLYLYSWLLKDLSWAQNWYYAAYFFGALAVTMSFVILFNATYDGATNEIFYSLAGFLWLFANFWWMTGT